MKEVLSWKINYTWKPKNDINRLFEEIYKPLTGGKLGITLNTNWFEPLDENDPSHVSIAEQSQQFRLGFWASPIFKGDFPDVVKDIIGNRSQAQG